MITISFREKAFGFGKDTPREFPGVKFGNGKIAFLNEQGEIRGSESEAKLLEALGATATISLCQESSVNDEQRESEEPFQSAADAASGATQSPGDSVSSSALAII